MVLDRAYVFTVGDISPDDLTALVDRLPVGLPQQSTRTLTDVAVLGLGEGVAVIDFVTPQSVALFGQIGIGRDHLDFFCCISLGSDFWR